MAGPISLHLKFGCVIFGIKNKIELKREYLLENMAISRPNIRATLYAKLKLALGQYNLTVGLYLSFQIEHEEALWKSGVKTEII